MSTDRPSPATSHPFQAEVSRLLHLMVHSVYTEKDVFLRELISNASDACDKLRYEAIAQPALIGDDARFAIRIEADKEAGRLVISDNGIGMNERRARREPRHDRPLRHRAPSSTASARRARTPA